MDKFKEFLKEEVNEEQFQETFNEYVKENGFINKSLFEKDYEEIIKEVPKIQSLADKKVTQGIQTFQEKHEEELREKIKLELNPPQTDEAKQLAELKKQFEEEKKARLLAASKNELYKYTKEQGLSDNTLKFLDVVAGADSDKNKELVNTFKSVLESEVSKVKEDFLKSNGQQIEQGQGNNSMTDEEYMRKAYENY